ncbi:hypothetical protein LTR62_008189 [Meristemomyces frigidus]|uniref:HAD-like protein n=1 Tax=Meristemomyces frigidus TaxID=1508187 RepID=A0AAN7YLZ7_9PEZI|nr:hypothetical protein LTR62_008189 [Meristemomyces frigidus]
MSARVMPLQAYAIRHRGLGIGKQLLICQRWTASGRKWYSPKTTEESSSRAHNGTAAQAQPITHLLGTITTGNAQRSSVDDLLHSLQEKRAGNTVQIGSGSSLLTLLFSPTYAQHALDSRVPMDFLKALLPEKHDALTKPVDVLTAVVDRLPSDSERLVGEEGMAYIFGATRSQLQADMETPFDAAVQKPGSLKFVLQPHQHRPWQYTIQVPLAQTVFSTGKPSTLLYRRYEHQGEKGPVRVESRFLESKTLPLPFVKRAGAVCTFVPLVPLTPFRIIRNAMGNIVRSLSSNTALDESKASAPDTASQPASQELEAVVSSYFKANSMSPEAVNVWALIVPHTKMAWSRLHHEHGTVRTLRRFSGDDIRKTWTSVDPMPKHIAIAANAVNSAVLRLLRNGGRLHRVLSGGGGWGKKAGLLSLDPDTIYSSRELRGEKGWDFDFDGEGAEAIEKQQRQALGELVKEGESIMFLLAPRDGGRFEEGSALVWDFMNKADQAAIFGAIPSTIDMMPDNSTIGEEDSQAMVRHHRGLFGALSEGGLALTIARHDATYRHTTHVPDANVVQTKFDVPFSHLRITESGDYVHTNPDQRMVLGKQRRWTEADGYFQAAENSEIEEDHNVVPARLEPPPLPTQHQSPPSQRRLDQRPQQATPVRRYLSATPPECVSVPERKDSTQVRRRAQQGHIHRYIQHGAEANISPSSTRRRRLPSEAVDRRDAASDQTTADVQEPGPSSPLPQGRSQMPPVQVGMQDHSHKRRAQPTPPDLVRFSISRVRTVLSHPTLRIRRAHLPLETGDKIEATWKQRKVLQAKDEARLHHLRARETEKRAAQADQEELWDMMAQSRGTLANLEKRSSLGARAQKTLEDNVKRFARGRNYGIPVRPAQALVDVPMTSSIWTKNNKSYILFGTVLQMPPPSTGRPRVLLFDIGGVCVVSPFQAILDYEKSRNIPPNWINHSIAASAPNGAWQKIERGDILMDAEFFREFKADLSNEQRWRTYYAKHVAATRKEKLSDAAEETAFQAPPVPDIDAEWLYWEMMRIAREPDPHMYPALLKLRAAADASKGQLILAALSNTSIFPVDHPFNDSMEPGSPSKNKALQGIFDVFISSAHVGMRKPDEEIYRYTITRVHEFVKTKFGGLGVKAEDFVFVDDIGANLRTARRLGMRTIKVDLGRADRGVLELEKVTGLNLRGDGKAKL